MPQTTVESPDFHPETLLRDWGNGHGFRLADAQTGVCAFGATGSGKTSGQLNTLPTVKVNKGGDEPGACTVAVAMDELPGVSVAQTVIRLVVLPSAQAGTQLKTPLLVIEAPFGAALPKL
jgi:hypothetical protein